MELEKGERANLQCIPVANVAAFQSAGTAYLPEVKEGHVR
jgi:hypothetical protein